MCALRSPLKRGESADLTRPLHRRDRQASLARPFDSPGEVKLKLEWFAGVDWGSQQHQVCVLDADGKVLGERVFEHGGAGLLQMADWLLSFAKGDASEVGVAVETPRGPVVESLMERGFAVHSINPKQLDRFRDRFSPAGAKDDRRDARVLASALRTDPHCLRRLESTDPAIVELREWSRLNEDLTRERVRRSANAARPLWDAQAGAVRTWLRGAVRDGPDRVLRAANEAEQPRIVAPPDLHGALEPVERRDRVVDGRLQVGDGDRLLVVALERAPDRGPDRRRGRGLRGGHPSTRVSRPSWIALVMTSAWSRATPPAASCRATASVLNIKAAYHASGAGETGAAAQSNRTDFEAKGSRPPRSIRGRTPREQRARPR